jgi:hypothetical protein
MTRPLSCGERAILAQDGDEGDPGPEFMRVRRIKAAGKTHSCAGCGEGWIAPGEPYDQVVTIEDGRFEIAAFCLGRGHPCPRAEETWKARDAALAEACAKWAEEDRGADD